MRIGTWNVENRLMTERHKELMLKQDPSRSNREANAGLVALAGANDLIFDNSVCIASSPPAFRNRWHRNNTFRFWFASLTYLVNLPRKIVSKVESDIGFCKHFADDVDLRIGNFGERTLRNFVSTWYSRSRCGPR